MLKEHPLLNNILNIKKDFERLFNFSCTAGQWINLYLGITHHLLLINSRLVKVFFITLKVSDILELLVLPCGYKKQCRSHMRKQI